MKNSRDHELQTLTLHSNVLVLLRTLYRMVLDYCVLKPSGGTADIVVFTKDQLISLIERSSPDISVGDISKLAARGVFKPMLVPDTKDLHVLVVGENGADVLPVEKVVASGEPSFPDWWEIPIPLALNAKEKLHVNPTALLMFGSDLKRMDVRDFPDRDEFLVALEDREPFCTYSFRRLEGNVFILENCTGDIAAAEEISWWAAVGRTWAKQLDREKRAYRRCSEDEAESFRKDCDVLPCEWEGELLGYFCVGKKTEENALSPEKRKKAGGEHRDSSKKTPRRSPVKSAVKQKNKEEDAPLALLGPQAMGLLAAGTNFMPSGEASAVSEKTPPRQTTRKTGKGERAKTDA